MGSFNGGCSISGTSVGCGDLVAFIPIKRVERDPVFIHETDALYIPQMLPIYGEYDDYGCLENIVRDSNVRLIEKRYDANIEDIVTYIIRREYTHNFEPNDKQKLELSDLTYMFIHKEIYDGITKDYKQGTQSEALRKDDLIKMGFRKVNKIGFSTRGDFEIYENENAIVHLFSSSHYTSFNIYKPGEDVLYNFGDWRWLKDLKSMWFSIFPNFDRDIFQEMVHENDEHQKKSTYKMLLQIAKENGINLGSNPSDIFDAYSREEFYKKYNKKFKTKFKMNTITIIDEYLLGLQDKKDKAKDNQIKYANSKLNKVNDILALDREVSIELMLNSKERKDDYDLFKSVNEARKEMDNYKGDENDEKEETFREYIIDIVDSTIKKYSHLTEEEKLNEIMEFYSHFVDYDECNEVEHFREWYTRKYKLFKELYLRNKTSVVKFKNELLRFHNLYLVLYETNRLFTPTSAGPQCGEINKCKEVNDLIKSFIDNKIKEYDVY